MRDLRGSSVSELDLSGANLDTIMLNDARIRTLEASGAVLRDVDLSNASIDGADVTGLQINGVEVAPLIDAELIRRQPARALRRSSDPAELREAWRLIRAAWERTYARVDARPELAVQSVGGEYSFTETLRHLVFATDVWLGALLGNDPVFHPWGIPFTGFTDYVEGPETFGLDVAATPSYEDVLDVRRQREASVAGLLENMTADRLADEIDGPPWTGGQQVSVQRSVWVVLNEELEHHRFAERDLDVLESPTSSA